VDTLLIIPNQNLFRVANEKTTFADAFAMADQVLYSGVACITDLMVKDGIIRVSVVATGIDNTGRMRDQGPTEDALKALAGKMRNDVRRMPAQPQVHVQQPAAFAPAQPPIPNPAIANAAASVESAAHAAVAAAILPQTAIDDVSIRPKPMKPSLFDQAEPEAPAHSEPPAPNFVPPPAERVMRAPRMPRIDELPLPARAMMEKQGQPAEHHPEERRKSLMQRLASVGLGRRAEESEAPPAPRT